MRTPSHQIVQMLAAVCLLVPALVFAAELSAPQEPAIAPPPAGIQAFQPGVALTYDVSWSGMFSAGTVTMTVETEKLPEGRDVLKFVVRGRTHGLMDKVYPVHDTVESVFDPKLMQSLSYCLRESYGNKKRLRTTEFDHVKRTAVCRLNEEAPETVATPAPVLDGLSLVYVLRTKEDLTTGRRVDIDVVDSGKNWTIEATVLERERIAIPAGEFETIKIRTQPKRQGVLLNKGIAYIRLTDDGWKVPVLMKSKLKVGSFVFELMDKRPGIHRISQ